MSPRQATVRDLLNNAFVKLFIFYACAPSKQTHAYDNKHF
uniref:Uncharacterized protein n=1 Tax=viral metagenome TaxID=1070528 RepID=A0A6C0C2X0_9ZZZZ